MTIEELEELRDQLSYHTAEQNCMTNTCTYCRDHVDALAGLQRGPLGHPGEAAAEAAHLDSLAAGEHEPERGIRDRIGGLEHRVEAHRSELLDVRRALAGLGLQPGVDQVNACLDVVERAAHGELARRLTAGAIVAAIVGVVAVGDGGKPAVLREHGQLGVELVLAVVAAVAVVPDVALARELGGGLGGYPHLSPRTRKRLAPRDPRSGAGQGRAARPPPPVPPVGKAGGWRRGGAGR